MAAAEGLAREVLAPAPQERRGDDSALQAIADRLRTALRTSAQPLADPPNPALERGA
ncbi:hypothetical protein AB0C98_03560 [Streptomyces sp. NPDC048558]|uniref:hypothetical protein n=1 Tax=Streptomyces sp. NPDC048558 TaxID=3155759 RepID=UPI0033EB0881